jgi:ketosteroid isomerase-like protein
MKTTQDILNNHLQSFARRDLQSILSDYAPDAVFFTQSGPRTGTDAIRPLFEALLAEFEKPGASFHLTHQVVEGDYAYILWTAETPDHLYELATDTFVIRHGKIVAQSFTANLAPRN